MLLLFKDEVLKMDIFVNTLQLSLESLERKIVKAWWVSQKSSQLREVSMYDVLPALAQSKIWGATAIATLAPKKEVVEPIATLLGEQ